MIQPITLASTSVSRKKVLTAAGVAFDAVSPGVDETAIKTSLVAEGATPRDIADALAELKAIKASGKRPGLVIGCDQTLDLEGQTIDKAETLAEARARLQSLRGKTHVLHAAVVVARNGSPIWREVKSARLTMRDFSDNYLEGYLEREGDAVLSSVGCYRLEGEGVQLFSRIDGDYFAILGLPLMGLLEFLRLHGALPR